MKTFFHQINRPAWVGIILALALLIYSWIAHFLQICFFWESNWYGWTVFLIAAILYLASRIRRKKNENKKKSFEVVCLVAVVFCLASQLAMLILYNRSDAYQVAQKYFRENKSYEQEVGRITGFAVHPFGYIQYHWGTGGEWGQAELDMVIKGEKKYKEVTVVLIKFADVLQWEVVEVHDRCGYCWIKDLALSMFLEQSDN